MRVCISAFALRVVCCSGLLVAAQSVIADEPAAFSPPLATDSEEAEKAIGGFKAPDGFKVEVVAAEPNLANPVAFCFDEKGRIYVAETYRHEHGVEDNRHHMDWLDDDLQSKTVEDREAYVRKQK